MSVIHDRDWRKAEMDQNTFKLLSPCCSAPLDPETEWRGHTVGEQVVGFSCSVCFNQWDRAGEPVPLTTVSFA